MPKLKEQFFILFIKLYKTLADSLSISRDRDK